MKRLLIILALASCGDPMLATDPPDAGADSGHDSQQSEAGQCSPCVPGYVRLYFAPVSEVWCGPTGDYRTETPCATGQIINWSRDGLVQCSEDCRKL